MDTDMVTTEHKPPAVDFLSDILNSRKSVRRYDPSVEISRTVQMKLCWAAQGLRSDSELRTAPSAGGCYPLKLYLLTKECMERYTPETERTTLVYKKDLRDDVATACLQQNWMADAPLHFVITADINRTMNRYGPRGLRYVFMDVGYAAENLHLMATHYGLGSCSVGAFDDDVMRRVLSTTESPMLVIPVGAPK